MRKIIFSLAVLLLLFAACEKKCRDASAVDPEIICFYFSLVDKDGNDLFFGKDSIYDPNNVKVASGQSDKFYNLHIGWVSNIELQRCFVIEDVPDEKTRFFYLKIFSEKIDIIRLETNITGYGNDPCVSFPIFTYDVFFNDIPICIDCSNNGIYKIEIK